MKKQITLTFLQYYYLLKSLLFKLLLLNPQAKKVINQRCSEDILFWLEFFVKLPPQTIENQPSNPKKDSRVHNRPGVPFFNKQENNTTSDKENRGIEKGDIPFSYTLPREGGGLENSLSSANLNKRETLSNRIQNLKASFKPQTTYNSYYWLQYKKNYILEIKRRIENNKPLLVSKSANMDETTCTALVLLWFWLYRKEANFYIVGQTAKHLFYTKDKSGIFNLYKYVLNNLPYSSYKSDQNPPKDDKRNKLPFSLVVNRKKKFFVKLLNHNNGNVIYGFSGSKRNYFPQHKKVKAVWLSNFAFHTKQHEHYNVLKNISECLIMTSIPNGKGNLFYELSMVKDLERYKLHWVLNPHYDEAWYDQIVSTMDLNIVHQFLDIGYEYKIKRQRVTRTQIPVKKIAKKVAVIQASTKRNRSTFSKTFMSEENKPRKSYHRDASFIYTPDNYEITKRKLANTALTAINIPYYDDNKYSNNIMRWHRVNILISKNNKARISSAKTALKVLFHYQPELINTFLTQPQTPIVNMNIKKHYTKEDLKTIFPYERLKREEPINQSSLVQTEEEFINHINKIAVRKYNPNFSKNMGITTEAGERGNAPLCDSFGQAFFLKGGEENSEATERSFAPLDKNLGSKPFLKGLEGDFLNNQETKKGEALCDSFGQTFFSKGLDGHCEEQSDAAILPTSNVDNNHETNTTNNSRVRKATKGGVSDSFGQAFFSKGGESSPFVKGLDEELKGITSEAGERGNAPLCDSLGSSPFLKGLGAVSGCDNLIPENNINKKTKDFFEMYKQNRIYKVSSTKFNITIKPPKFQRDKENNKEEEPP